MSISNGKRFCDRLPHRPLIVEEGPMICPSPNTPKSRCIGLGRSHRAFDRPSIVDIGLIIGSIIDFSFFKFFFYPLYILPYTTLTFHIRLTLYFFSSLYKRILTTLWRILVMEANTWAELKFPPNPNSTQLQQLRIKYTNIDDVEMK